VEILVTIAYFFLVRLVFFDYALIRFTLFWKFVVFGFYALAALTEVVMLGQFTPYSKLAVVESYVIQLAPEFGGIVKDVYVESNQQVKTGDPLFQMDPEPWKDRVAKHQAAYDLANDEYQRLKSVRGSGAVSQMEVDTARDELAVAQAELTKAQYNLDHATIRAPTDGYVVNVVLRPGAFIRLKAPVMDFVSTEEFWVSAIIHQKASQWVKVGNEVEVALEMYPGRVFAAAVESVTFATSRAQLTPEGRLPPLDQHLPSEFFPVRIRLQADDPRFPMRFGAKALAAIYTGRGPDVFRLLRELEIRSESWLNYIYNPF
jgi:multidrug resistance efflux pump